MKVKVGKRMKWVLKWQSCAFTTNIPDNVVSNIVHSTIEAGPWCCCWSALDWQVVMVNQGASVGHCTAFLVRRIPDPNKIATIKMNVWTKAIPAEPLAVVFSKHLNKWWCCSSKISSSRYVSSNSIPDSCAANRASAAFFLLTNAAPLDAFAIRIRAKRAFCIHV